MSRKLAPLTVLLTLLALGVPSALAATKDTATAEASPGPYFVGEPITFTSTTPCTVACRLTWTQLNGTRLGDRIGEGVAVTTSFSTPGLKTVELELNELCVGSPRLTCSSFAFVSVFVEVAQAPTDTTPPTFTVSGLAVEATAPSTVVNYTFNASDPDDAVASQSCTPAPGSLFLVGSTPISCTATDSHGNVGNETFDVVVSDTTAPTLTVPNDLTANATSPAGASLTYVASASDLVDGALTPDCSQASGSTFAIGTTTVTCTASDAHGNTSAESSFTVHVNGAAEQVAEAVAQVIAWNLKGHPLENDLQKILARDSTARACREVRDFIADLNGSHGKRLTTAQREWLSSGAARIANVLGC